MTNQKRISLTLSLIVIFLLLANCTPSSAEPRLPEIQTVTETLPASSSSTPSSIPVMPIGTTYFVPTIYPEQEAKMADLLNEGNCELPCYLGIIPGSTSWEEAQDVLRNIGANFQGEFTEDSLPVYEYTLWVGDPSAALITHDANTGLTDLVIDQSIDLTVANDTVQRIVVSLQAQKFAKKFREYWSMYSLRDVLQGNGVPNKIYFGIPKWGSGYFIFVVYEHSGVVLMFNGYKRGNFICPLSLSPKESEYPISLEITLTNTDILSDIFRPENIPPTDKQVYLPIQDALGISEQQFYDYTSSNSETCFKIMATSP